MSTSKTSIKVASEYWRDYGDEARFSKPLTEKEFQTMVEYVVATMALSGLELPRERVEVLARQAIELPLVKI